jgi:hypothetical protein
LSFEKKDFPTYFLNTQMRGDKARGAIDWAWTATGSCYRYGPGLNCSDAKEARRRGVSEEEAVRRQKAATESNPFVTQYTGGGADPDDPNHFYINYKDPKALYLYPRRIELYNWVEMAGKNNTISRWIFDGGKDDHILRLDKTVCWKEDEEEKRPMKKLLLANSGRRGGEGRASDLARPS